MEGFQIEQRCRFKSGVPLLLESNSGKSGCLSIASNAVTGNFNNKVFAATDTAGTVPSEAYE
jgi:hypothetical protein